MVPYRAHNPETPFKSDIRHYVRRSHSSAWSERFLDTEEVPRFKSWCEHVRSLWSALVRAWRGRCWFGTDALDMDDYASGGHWYHVKHHTCPPEERYR